MKLRTVCLLLILFVATTCKLYAQPVADTLFLQDGDTVIFNYQIPPSYSSANPPAILIWWHQLGGYEYEVFNYTDFDDEAMLRGWIICSHLGPNDRHWNTRRAQKHCKAMLDWMQGHYPFSLDSLYMIGGSMGGAAGQVWHNNNCGIHDYLCAANAGGSQILDCQLRQEQYLATGDTNRSMRVAFGGLPSEGDSIAFEYHRYSAIHLADTSRSMHSNSYHLPVWSTWGNSDFERDAYGFPAMIWDSLRRGHADTTYYFEFPVDGHGLQIMWPTGVCDWLSHFTVNRYPDFITITADEADEYYWTEAELAYSDTIFGKYSARKSFDERRLDLNIVRNISDLTVEWEFPWLQWDSLYCDWQNIDPNTENVTVRLQNVGNVLSVRNESGQAIQWVYENGDFVAQLHGHSQFTITFEFNSAEEPHAVLVDKIRLASAYPNPFNSDITLTLGSNLFGKDEIVLYDILGREAMVFPIELRVGSQEQIINAKGLASGIYFVNLKKNRSQPLKIVLMK